MTMLTKLNVFRREEKGSVAMIFALMGTAMFGVAGLAVDYGRALSTHTKLQGMADAAALQGALMLKYTGGDEAKAKLAAEAHINGLRTDNGLAAASNDPTTTTNGNAVTVTATAATGAVVVTTGSNVPSYFMGLLGVSEMPVQVTATASVAVKSLDLGMMVDVTGSMGYSDNTISTSDCAEADGTRLGAARCAAKDLVDILYPVNSINTTGDSTTIRTAVAPFSQMVKVSQTMAQFATGANPTRSCRNYKTRRRYNSTCTNSNWTSSSSCYRTGTYCDGTPSGSVNTDYVTNGNSYTQYLTGCMIERNGRNTTDDNPAGDFTAQWSNSQNASCTPNYEMTGLTGSRSSILATVNNLTNPQGGTAGHMGTAWAWYSISPNFASGLPANAQPAAYDDPRTLKAVILLTDGDFTMHNTAGSCNGSDGCSTSRTDARALCTAMKAKNVMVFAVGFGLANSQNQLTPAEIAALPESDGRKVLADCAGEGRYFFPYDGTALRVAFQDIGKALTAVLGNPRLAENN